MDAIPFTQVDTGSRYLFISHQPRAWFTCDADDVDSVRTQFKQGDKDLLQVLRQNSIPDRSPNPSHLAMYPVIKLTNRCNLNCSHCYIEAHDSMKSGKYNLEFKDVANFVEYIIDLGEKRGEPTLTMQLFGGEPTLHSQFSDILTYIREKGIYVRVSTNAANVKLFQSGRFDKHFQDPEVEWRVSLESHLPEAHNQIRPNSYHNVVDNLRYMASHGARISIKTVVGQHNYDHFEDIIYFSHDIGATDYLYSPLSLTGNALKNNIINRITTLMINKKVIGLIEKDHAMGPFLRSSPLARYLKLIYLRQCSVLPRVQFFVNHDGKVCPQDNLYEMPAYHFGNIFEGDYGLEEVERYQRQIESELEACKSCGANGFCPKGDYADLAMKDSEFNSEFSVCDDIREVVYYLMSLEDRGTKLLDLIYA